MLSPRASRQKSAAISASAIQKGFPIFLCKIGSPQAISPSSESVSAESGEDWDSPPTGNRRFFGAGIAQQPRLYAEPSPAAALLSFGRKEPEQYWLMVERKCRFWHHVDCVMCFCCIACCSRLWNVSTGYTSVVLFFEQLHYTTLFGKRQVDSLDFLKKPDNFSNRRKSADFCKIIS